MDSLGHVDIYRILMCPPSLPSRCYATVSLWSSQLSLLYLFLYVQFLKGTDKDTVKDSKHGSRTNVCSPHSLPPVLLFLHLHGIKVLLMILSMKDRLLPFLFLHLSRPFHGLLRPLTSRRGQVRRSRFSGYRQTPARPSTQRLPEITDRI